MSVFSNITEKNGYPQLSVNGEIQDGLAYITYLSENNRYSDFTQAGYRMFSVPVFFGFNRLNEYSGIDVFTKGIFDRDEPDFSVFDADIKRILDVCPKAYILPRVNVSLSRSWELAHPDELCDPYPDGRLGRASLASDIWAGEVRRELGIFIAHIKKSVYASHIVGYQVAGGNTEEWLPLDEEKGISGLRAREKYGDYLKSHGCEDSDASFYRFYSELVADRIIEFSAEIKRLTDRKVAVGTFYGYTLECPFRHSGHHALEKVLESDDIDFICSPVSYSKLRAVGREHPYMLPLASVKHHGKLYFSENDTRTHLSRAVNDMPWYNTPIWFGPDRETSCNVIKMHAARALIYRHAAWWFDMWGGWFDDSEYMELLKSIRELFEKNSSLPVRSATETAVFIDERAYALVPTASEAKKVIIRESLGTMGAPYDLYLSSDAPSVIDRYKAVISLVPTQTDASRSIRELAQKEKIAFLEVTQANADITPKELRNFLYSSGVHVWCDRDAVIYANDRFLFLHTAEDGEYTLNIPSDKPLRDIFENKPFPKKAYLKKGQSLLFSI